MTSQTMPSHRTDYATVLAATHAASSAAFDRAIDTAYLGVNDTDPDFVVVELVQYFDTLPVRCFCLGFAPDGTVIVDSETNQTVARFEAGTSAAAVLRSVFVPAAGQPMRHHPVPANQ